MTPVLGEVSRKALSVLQSGEIGLPISFTGRAESIVDIAPGGQTSTRSGFRVTSDGALRLAAVWIATTFIADEVSSLPARILERDDVSRVPLRPSSAPALWQRPNHDQFWMAYQAAMTLSLTLTGNAYAQLRWMRDGSLGQIWPLDPHIVNLERERDKENEPGTRLVAERLGELHNRPGERPEFMHVPFFQFPGQLKSMSPVAYASELIGEGAAYMAASARLAGRGFRPSAILTVDAEIEDAQARTIARRLEHIHQGTDNYGKVVVVGGKDAKLVPVTMSLADAEAVKRSADIFDILLAIWRVPPTVAGMANKTSSWGTGVAEFTRGVERFTLRPVTRRFEAAYDDVLQWLNPAWTLRYKYDALLASSPMERAQVQRLNAQSGMTSLERVLAQNDEPPFTEDETVMFPLNMVTREGHELDMLRRRAEVYGTLIRAGATPEAASTASGLPLEHLGLAPVTVQPPDEPPAEPPVEGDDAGEGE